jgi:hypothetical protein
MRKAIAILILALPLQGCDYSYPIHATMVGGRLAFESGDRAYRCFTNIRVSAMGPLAPDRARDSIPDLMERGRAQELARSAWKTDAVATYECKGYFPVVYGAAMPGITIVPAKPLRIGVVYEVSTYGPKGAGGHGCFRINPDRRPENLPDQDCVYSESTQPAPVQPGQGSATSSSPPKAGEMTPTAWGIATSTPGGGSMTPKPINAMPPPDRTGPSQMYSLTPYRAIDRYLRDYPSLAACERARAKMPREEAALRLCGLRPGAPPFPDRAAASSHS